MPRLNHEVTVMSVPALKLTPPTQELFHPSWMAIIFVKPAVDIMFSAGSTPKTPSGMERGVAQPVHAVSLTTLHGFVRNSLSPLLMTLN